MHPMAKNELPRLWMLSQTASPHQRQKRQCPTFANYLPSNRDESTESRKEAKVINGANGFRNGTFTLGINPLNSSAQERKLSFCSKKESRVFPSHSIFVESERDAPVANLKNFIRLSRKELDYPRLFCLLVAVSLVSLSPQLLSFL
jgi:hypothetical protein